MGLDRHGADHLPAGDKRQGDLGAGQRQVGIFKSDGINPNIERDAGLSIFDAPTDHGRVLHLEPVPGGDHVGPGVPGGSPQNRPFARLVDEKDAYVVIIEVGADQVDDGRQQVFKVENGCCCAGDLRRSLQLDGAFGHHADQVGLFLFGLFAGSDVGPYAQPV